MLSEAEDEEGVDSHDSITFATQCQMSVFIRILFPSSSHHFNRMGRILLEGLFSKVRSIAITRSISTVLNFLFCGVFADHVDLLAANLPMKSYSASKSFKVHVLRPDLLARCIICLKISSGLAARTFCVIFQQNTSHRWA